jgi:DNA adenine methylase
MEGEGRAAKTMRPPICRIGTKKSLLDKVFKAFPDDSAYDTYVEPFIGGGAVYWAKDPTKREVINDLDSELIELYRTLKTTRSRDFRTDLTSQPAIQSFFNKGKPRSDATKLQYGIVASCNRWMGRQTGNIIYSPADPHKKTKNIDDYQERMKGTIIHNESYEKVLRKYDSPRTFFYLDPPYQDSKTLYKVIKDTDFDFPRLKEELSRLKGKWLLSINDSKYIRDLFKGFYAKGVTVKARSKGMNSIGSKDRKELLIANYAF